MVSRELCVWPYEPDRGLAEDMLAGASFNEVSNEACEVFSSTTRLTSVERRSSMKSTLRSYWEETSTRAFFSRGLLGDRLHSFLADLHCEQGSWPSHLTCVHTLTMSTMTIQPCILH